MAALRTAEAHEIDVERALPAIIRMRSLEGAKDIAAVLHGRLEACMSAGGVRTSPEAGLVAGLVPLATRIADPDMARALAERARTMERRTNEQTGGPPSHLPAALGVEQPVADNLVAP